MTGIFFEKGCQVVKTPMYTGFATSKRLSEVVIRLSSSRQPFRGCIPCVYKGFIKVISIMYKFRLFIDN